MIVVVREVLHDHSRRRSLVSEKGEVVPTAGETLRG